MYPVPLTRSDTNPATDLLWWLRSTARAADSMAVDTLEMAQAIRRSGLPQEQAGTIAEQIGKGFASDDLATKEFVRVEIADLRTDPTRQMGELRAELHKEMGLLSWKTAGMLLLQAGLVATLTRLL